MTPPPSDRELVTTERVAIVTYMLTRGHRLTTLEAGIIAGVSRQGAWAMLNKIGRVLPLCGPDTNDQRWQMLPDEDAGAAP